MAYQQQNVNKQEAPPILNLDRPKPSNVEAEIAVLGAMLLAPESAATAFSALRFEGAFYRPAHQAIFNAMLELNGGKSEAALDPVVLADHLERLGSGRSRLPHAVDGQRADGSEHRALH